MTLIVSMFQNDSSKSKLSNTDYCEANVGTTSSMSYI